MLELPKALKIYAATLPCDMRKQGSGLLGMVHAALGRPAAQHELYLFWGRKADLLKVLYLDPTGVCVFTKRLNKGRFEMSFEKSPGQATVTLDAKTLSSIVAAVHAGTHKPGKRIAMMPH